MLNKNIPPFIQVKLKDALVSSLNFSTAQDIELAWVDGQLVMEERGEKFDKMEIADIQKKEVVPILEQMPQEIVREILLTFRAILYALSIIQLFFEKFLIWIRQGV